MKERKNITIRHADYRDVFVSFYDKIQHNINKKLVNKRALALLFNLEWPDNSFNNMFSVLHCF